MARRGAARFRAGTKSRVGPRPQVFCDANAHRVARRGKNTWDLADNVPALRRAWPRVFYPTVTFFYNAPRYGAKMRSAVKTPRHASSFGHAFAKKEMSADANLPVQVCADLCAAASGERCGEWRTLRRVANAAASGERCGERSVRNERRFVPHARDYNSRGETNAAASIRYGTNAVSFPTRGIIIRAGRRTLRRAFGTERTPFRSPCARL